MKLVLSDMICAYQDQDSGEGVDLSHVWSDRTLCVLLRRNYVADLKLSIDVYPGVGQFP